MSCPVSAGIAGIVCLLLSVRLAHASLQRKLKARTTTTGQSSNVGQGPIQPGQIGENDRVEPLKSEEPTEEKAAESSQKYTPVETDCVSI